MKISRIQDEIGRTVMAVCEDDGSLLRAEGDIYAGDLKVTDEQVKAVKWLCPVEPKVIMCVAANYKSHIEECNMNVPEWPVFFIKNLGAANSHLEPIVIPEICDDEVDFEGELAIIIGKPCRNAARDKVYDYILGYTIAHDVSARKWQKEKGGGQWCRGKGFDTFCPMGPYLVTRDEIENPGNLNIKTEFNGKIVQDGNTNLMIFDIPTLISFISQGTTLLPGTVLLTGTPAGVGWTRSPKLLMKKGDRISVSIEKLGTLTNFVS